MLKKNNYIAVQDNWKVEHVFKGKKKIAIIMRYLTFSDVV